jgi:hypothetical protein
LIYRPTDGLDWAAAAPVFFGVSLTDFDARAASLYASFLDAIR